MGKISDELKRKLEADPNDVDAIVQAVAELEEKAGEFGNAIRSVRI